MSSLDKPFDIKITVLKNVKTDDILREFGKDTVESECPLHKTGQEFIVKDLNKPEGFCSWAWADIHRDIATLAMGGNFFWIKKPGNMVSCCTDGLRPVIFKLERIE